MLATYILLLLAEDTPTPSLLKVEPGLAFWTVVAFGIAFGILYKYAWPAITTAMETREEKITESMERAEKALAEAKQISADNEKARREAEQEAQRILREARDASERLRADELDKTRAQIKQAQETAQAEIEREKQSAIEQLRAEVTELAIQAAGKILQENMDGDRQRKLVDKFIDDLPKN
ncbi:MAG: F0F1 ATP synthase subunit B [Bacteroidota bacterium]